MAKRKVGDPGEIEGLVTVTSGDKSINPDIVLYDHSDFNTDQITDILSEVVEASTTEALAVEHNANEIAKANAQLKATLTEAERILNENEARKRLAMARQNAQVKFNQKLTDRANSLSSRVKKS